MEIEQLLALSVRVARAHEALTDLRTELEGLRASHSQMRMIDNALQALDTLSSVLRVQPSPSADEQ